MWNKLRPAVAVMLFGFSTLNGQVTAKPESKPLASNATVPDAVNAEATASYIIQPNDVLEIFVWKEPDLNRKVLVGPDGRISVPQVQDIQAAGLTRTQLKEQIEKKLKESLTVPNVTVLVDTFHSIQVYVTGQVLKPGEIKEQKPITVLQALAMAGGFPEYANVTKITIIRGDKILKFNYDEVIEGKNLSQNILLQAGDVVAVPK